MLVSNVVHEWFQHKLNYFLFCQKFEKNIYYLCQNFNNYYKSNSEMFCLSSLNFKLAISRSKECDGRNTLRLSHNDNKILFIVLYKYYLPKISELKKPIAKVKI